MRNIITRSLTGFIYVILTLGSILLGKYTFLAYFTIVLIYTLYEFYRLCKIGNNKPQTILGIITAVYLFASFYLYDFKMTGSIVFWGLIPITIYSAVIEIIKQDKHPVQNIAYTLFGIAYIAFPFSILNFIATPLDRAPEQYLPFVLIGLFVILWTNDSGAYLVGSMLGKTKMCERISPNKTWEGAIGGTIIAIIASIIFFHFTNILSPIHAIFLSILTVIAGTLGDLTESLLKRSFNVKDSGKVLPGHGGLLDRFDSMLFAAPIYYIYISVVLNLL